PNF
ncbi:hypothetical protein CP8484711_1771B, partial [Chlamydia psittaci 84-8471/1]